MASTKAQAAAAASGLEAFEAAFRDAQALLPGRDLDWLQQARAAAMREALALGLPGPKSETWRHAPSLARLVEGLQIRDSKAAPFPLELAEAPLDALAGHAVFVEGQLHKELSDLGPLQGLADLAERSDERLQDLLSEKRPAEDCFQALNRALWQDGILLDLPANSALELPLAVTALSGGADDRQSHSSNHLRLGANAQATIIERHGSIGNARQVTNSLTHVSLGPGATLRHLILLEDRESVASLNALIARLQRDSRYELYVLFAGQGFARFAPEIALAEPGASCLLNGGYLLDGEGQGDLTSLIVHEAAHTTSQETVKGALGGKARQAFRGTISVAKGADEADGRMQNKTLLLSDKAEIDAKPELLISHDKVQCAHGCTSGKIDETALFYLRSRGLPLPAARRLLLQSFLAETVEDLSDGAMKSLIAQRLDRRLGEMSQ